MADWHGTSRSNYVRVTDLEKFIEYVNHFEATLVVQKGGKVALLSQDEYGGEPSLELENMADTEFVELAELLGMELTELQHKGEQIHLTDFVHHWLPDDEVFIWMVSGAEKQRYVTGHALALNSKGERVEISIWDIYTLAKAKFGVEPTRCEN